MEEAEEPREGSLTVVGAGIRAGLHLTQEGKARIQGASKVLYLLAEQAPTEWIESLNPTAESLAPLYQSGREHAEVYEALVSAMLEWVRHGEDVCAVTYGNPAVFDQSSHEAVRRARAEGFQAKILPGISAMDCLFVDLGLDPGRDGLQSFDADDFLSERRVPDTSVPLVLWQISVISETRTGGMVNREGLRILGERLVELYGDDHEVIVYEATPFPAGQALIEPCLLKGLSEAEVTGMSTLYVPPASKMSADAGMVERLMVSDALHGEQ